MSVMSSDYHAYHVSRAASLPPFLELLAPAMVLGSGAVAVAEKRPGALARFVAGVRHSLAVRKTVAELRRLDDSMLDDIGLHRADINAAAVAAVAKMEKPTSVFSA